MAPATAQQRRAQFARSERLWAPLLPVRHYQFRLHSRFLRPLTTPEFLGIQLIRLPMPHANLQVPQSRNSRHRAIKDRWEKILLQRWMHSPPDLPMPRVGPWGLRWCFSFWAYWARFGVAWLQTGPTMLISSRRREPCSTTVGPAETSHTSV